MEFFDYLNTQPAVWWVILTTAVLFLGMILLLASKPKFAGWITGAFVLTAALSGLCFYGYGFTMTEPNVALAVVRALLGVCGMFVAKMDLSAISSAPHMDKPEVQFLFWLVHLLALYATASAAVTTVGAEALRKLRLFLARWGKLNLIFGLNEKTLALGKQLLSDKAGAVVFIDGEAPDGLAGAVARAGCVLRSDSSALRGDRKFLRGIGANRQSRILNLYALDADAGENLRYARTVLESLKAWKVEPTRTRLVIRGQEDSVAAQLQVVGERYGYGYVSVIRESELVARLLVRQYPPCNAIAFDENARAKENFEALVVGFGKVGQDVLRHLVMNSQFEGSHFRAAVFAPDCEAVKGYFYRCNPMVPQAYDITFHPFDARSEQMYSYLGQRAEKLRYIVLCTGSDRMNEEIGEDLQVYFKRMGQKIPIYLCGYRGVKDFGSDEQVSSLYRPEVLNAQNMDQMAMLVNHHYEQKNRTALEAWMALDYFDRMSNRASADFVPAMLRMAGKTAETVKNGGWDLTAAQLENMSKTEHLRWCAFHYCMGYKPMTWAEFDSRATEYRRQKAAGEENLIAIRKNKEGRTHACLIPWEQIPELSDRECAVTGVYRDYQKLDSVNVEIVPELLQRLAAEE